MLLRPHWTKHDKNLVCAVQSFKQKFSLSTEFINYWNRNYTFILLKYNNPSKVIWIYGHLNIDFFLFNSVPIGSSD